MENLCFSTRQRKYEPLQSNIERFNEYAILVKNTNDKIKKYMVHIQLQPVIHIC